MFLVVAGTAVLVGSSARTSGTDIEKAAPNKIGNRTARCMVASDRQPAKSLLRESAETNAWRVLGRRPRSISRTEASGRTRNDLNEKSGDRIVITLCIHLDLWGTALPTLSLIHI